MTWVITTSKRATATQIQKAKEISEHLNVPFINRSQIKSYMEENPTGAFVSVEKQQLVFWCEKASFFWHPSTSKLSLGELERFRASSLPKALRLEAGDVVVDATLGLASDALRIALLLGEKGQVLGTEENEIMALLTKEGLRELGSEGHALALAARKIEVFHTHHLAYLKNLPSKSVSAVYFDPMFQAPKNESHAINAFRQLALHESLSEEVIQEAVRVARKAVVVKERYGMGELKRLNLPLYYGRASYGEVGYGAIHL